MLKEIYVLISCNVWSEEKKLKISFNNNTTLDTLLRMIGHPDAEIDFTKYYIFNNEYCHAHRCLPYLISENVAVWFPKYNESNVVDFIKTLNSEKNKIYLSIQASKANGPDLFTIAEMWDKYFPVIAKYSSVIGSVAGTVTVVKWLKSIFTSKRIPPSSVFELIFSRKAWNHFELSQVLQIDVDNTKNLLQAVGYQWDKKEMMYIQTAQSLNCIDSLSNITWYKHG